MRIHRGVAEIINSERSGPPLTVWAASLADAEGAGDSDAVGRIGYRAHVLGHSDIAANAWARIDDVDEPATRWLAQAASFSRGQHRPSAAIPLLGRLLELVLSGRGSHHREVAVILTTLGTAWRDLGELAKARELFERALTIGEREYGPDHPRVAASLVNLGGAWTRVGEPARPGSCSSGR